MSLIRVAIALAILSSPAYATAASPEVRLADGAVRGSERSNVRSFLGIPYAAPPTGDARWLPPQPPRPWTTVRDATRFGPSCWQAVAAQGFGPWSHEYVVQGDIAEDCLTLNVWAPAKARGAPVLFWIHGGGFNSGSGSLPIYDGAALARRGIIVVTINYRVNVFGFLSHPGLGSAPANFGLLDMVAALEWTKRNIGQFGGDPGQVTIAGQSAGAAAVHELVASPQAHGLFVRAIAESGLPVGRALPVLATAAQDGAAFAREKGAMTLAALRQLPAEALQPSSGANTGRFTPVIDGKLLPLQPDVAISSGQSADVPMLAGFTADEASSSATYPTTDPEPARARWRANIDAWATLRARSGRAPTYTYYFSHVAPGPESARWGAYHSSEIPYVFGNLAAAPERHYTAGDERLSDTMARYWVNFVRSGNPNGPGLPDWPAYIPGQSATMEFGNTVAARPAATPKVGAGG